MLLHNRRMFIATLREVATPGWIQQRPSRLRTQGTMRTLWHKRQCCWQETDGVAMTMLLHNCRLEGLPESGAINRFKATLSQGSTGGKRGWAGAALHNIFVCFTENLCMFYWKYVYVLLKICVPTCIEKPQSSYRIEVNKENHLFYGIESWDLQVICSEKKLHAHATWPFKDGPKKFRRVPQFLFLIIVQTKYSLQSSDFLLTKDKENADNVHQGPLSVDFDDEWICA